MQANQARGATFLTIKTGGQWSHIERQDSINVLELKAVLFGLCTLVNVTDTHVKILTDNTTAVHTINNMGTSHSRKCNEVVQKIWNFAISKNLWLSATHLPGKLNIEADKESRKKEIQLEWKLSENLFSKVCHKFNVAPNIDLFASRINHHIKPFISYRPDPEAFAVNAFLSSWENWKFYAFNSMLSPLST